MTAFGIISPSPASKLTIMPSLLHSGLRNGKYIFAFSNSCWTGDYNTFGTVTNVNKIELKQKLESWIKPGDRKYIKLTYFDTSRSIFEFAIDDWFEDGIKNVKPHYTFVKWQKNYKLKVQMPYMCRVFANYQELDKYVASAFKTYCREHPQMRKTVFNIITDEIEKKMRLEYLSFFEYIYDRNLNTISVRLKNVYQFMIIDALWKQQQKNVKTIGFEKSVKGYQNIMSWDFWSKQKLSK